MSALIATLCLFFFIEITEAYDVISSLSFDSCNHSSYFDSLSHTCKSCGVFEKASDDHLNCECNVGYYAEFNEKSKVTECVRCNENVIQSDSCLKSNLTCESYEIKVLQVLGNETTARCLKCPLWHQPDDRKSVCIPCSNMCHCPSDYEDVNGTCVRDFGVIPDSPTLSIYNLYGRPYVSSYFRDRVRIIAAKCKVQGGKHCEHLANLCVLSDYNYDSQSACTFYRQLASGFGNSIYYDEATNVYLLNSARINLMKDQTMDFVVKQYTLNGTYQMIQPLQSVFTSLCCTGFWGPIYRNTNIRHSCALNPKVYDKADMHFYELYFVDRAVNQSRLINIPVKISNFIRGGVLRNKDNDISRWQLTKRFFNIDVATGSNPDGNVDFIRFLSYLTIRISVIPNEKPLGLKLPYAILNYDTIGSFQNGQSPVIYFAMENTVSMDEAMKSVDIALSVLSSFGALYAMIRIVVWYFRSDKTTIDLLTLIRLLIYGADILANVILTVVFLSTFYWLITFRQQEEITISLPGQQEEQFIKDLVISAFTLKAISILWMIGEQCTIDIFLVDWESPRPNKGETVSVWRMYFVANEWNELQVSRKSSMSCQIILVLLILKVFEFERFALEIPSTYFVRDSRLNFNTILRLALGLATYLSVSLAQNIWNAAIFERFVEHKIQRFTDVCTLSNISVWFLLHARYGFYIHGRSPHGFADIDMPTMCQQLQREEDNLCAQRGLVQGQDTQTFSICFHQNLLDKWRKLQSSTVTNNQFTGNNPVINALNQFLTSFLDHALRDLDYEVRDKHFIETVLDMELWTNKPVERTVFYNDGRNCFGSVLFYGNETALVVFELLLFSLVDIHCHNYLTAGLTVFIIFKVLQFIRSRLGRRNLAKKTRIDPRFLF